jgi:hypothetical protein
MREMRADVDLVSPGQRRTLQIMTPDSSKMVQLTSPTSSNLPEASGAVMPGSNRQRANEPPLNQCERRTHTRAMAMLVRAPRRRATAIWRAKRAMSGRGEMRGL